jgi:hypothetical protein
LDPCALVRHRWNGSGWQIRRVWVKALRGRDDRPDSPRQRP